MPSKSVQKMSQSRRTLEFHGLYQKDVLLTLLSFLPPPPPSYFPPLFALSFSSPSTATHILPLPLPSLPLSLLLFPFPLLSTLSLSPPLSLLPSSTLLRGPTCLTFDMLRKLCISLCPASQSCDLFSGFSWCSAPGSSETFGLKLFEHNMLIS